MKKFRTYLQIGILLGLVILFACEKDYNSFKLTGKWTFYEACNLNLYIGSVKAINRDFNEIIEFKDNKVTRYFDDSIVSITPYKLGNGLIIYGKDNIFAQEFLLKNDTLTLIDTCVSCYYTVYIRSNP